MPDGQYHARPLLLFRSQFSLRPDDVIKLLPDTNKALTDLLAGRFGIIAVLDKTQRTVLTETTVENLGLHLLSEKLLLYRYLIRNQHRNLLLFNPC